MNSRNLTKTRRLSTSSFGSPPDTSPMELAALGAHLSLCEVRRGPLFALKCTGEALNDFMAPRLVTISALFALLGTFACLVS